MRYLALVLLVACSGSDWTQGPVPPSEPNRRYQEFCDAAVPYIEADCAWNVRCGFIEAEGYDACVELYATATIYVRGCHADLEYPDSSYDTCLNDFDTLACVPNTIPDSCWGIW